MLKKLRTASLNSEFNGSYKKCTQSTGMALAQNEWGENKTKKLEPMVIFFVICGKEMQHNFFYAERPGALPLKFKKISFFG